MGLRLRCGFCVLLVWLSYVLWSPALSEFKAQDATPETTPEATPEGTPHAAASVTCPAVVRTALEEAARACTGTTINSLCYGSGQLDWRSRETADFADPGDAVDVALVESLSLRGFVFTETGNAAANGYSIAILRPRANLTEGALTMVAFGEVVLENISDAPPDFVAREVVVRRGPGANVRTSPDDSGEVIGAYYWGQTLTAIGRTTDSTWLRVLAEGQAGWVRAELVTAEFDITLLAETAPDDSPVLYAPFQAFDVTTSQFDSPCPDELDETGPESGVLIQTPNLAQAAQIVVNNLPLTFNGTLYLQTTPEALLINLFEGEVTLGDARFGTELLTLQPGEMATVGLDAEGLYAAYPDAAEEYSFVRSQSAPLSLLPRPVNLPFSLVGVVQPFEPNTGFLQSLPADGQCVVAWSVAVNLRSGPGRDYPIWQGLAGGYAAQPDARAVGTDGMLWWRLAPGVWLNSDATGIAGLCGLLPLVDLPPRP
ncbi:MAG: SH3 domain-containing protein [bacterium]|nr:SH3 domain-containing protein [bacterium]